MRIRLLSVFPILLAATSLQAQTPQRFGVVDFDHAVIENAEGIKARKKVDAVAKEWQDKVDVEAAKQKTLRDRQLQPGVSESEKTKIAQQLRDIDTAIERIRVDAAKAIGDRRDEVFRPIAERVRVILKAYGEENNLAAIISESSSVEGIVYEKRLSTDITAEIIRRLDADLEKNPLKTAPAPAAAAPKNEGR